MKTRITWRKCFSISSRAETWKRKVTLNCSRKIRLLPTNLQTTNPTTAKIFIIKSRLCLNAVLLQFYFFSQSCKEHTLEQDNKKTFRLQKNWKEKQIFSNSCLLTPKGWSLRKKRTEMTKPSIWAAQHQKQDIYSRWMQEDMRCSDGARRQMHLKAMFLSCFQLLGWCTEHEDHGWGLDKVRWVQSKNCRATDSSWHAEHPARSSPSLTVPLINAISGGISKPCADIRLIEFSLCFCELLMMAVLYHL